ncbi:MAG TPA: TetR/AcrR family transcriptional regulator [Acidimicrobiales bacterium]
MEAEPTPVNPPADRPAEVLPPDAGPTGTPRRLLEAAVELFALRGYFGVSVRDITAAIGVRPASLYNHYASKEELLVAAMRLGHEWSIDRAAAAIDALGPGASPTDRLRAAVAAHARTHAEYPLLSRVCSSELHGLGDEALATVLGLRMASVAQLSAIVDDGVTTGEFAVDDVFLAVMAISAMVIRLANWYGGNRVGLEFGPALPPGLDPAALYPVDRLTATYADYALRLVTAP